MKKTVAMILVLVMVLVAGCGQSDTTNESASGGEKTDASGTENTGTESESSGEETADTEEAVQEEPKEPVKLVVWESEGQEQEFVEYAIREFNKLYPHIEIEFQPVTHVDSSAKMELDGPNGEGADVFAAPHDHLGRLVTAGLVLENDVLNTEDYLNASVIGTSFEGVMYGYPTAIETYALFVNTDVAEEIPDSFDDIFEFADEFNDESANRYALMWDVDNAYFSYCFLGGFDADLFGPNGDDKTILGFDTENGYDALTFFQSVREIYDVNAEDADEAAMNTAFNDGNAAFMITGPWSIQGLKDAGVNFEIAPLPLLPNGNRPKSFSGVRANYVSAFTEHPEEAKLFAEFMSSIDMLTKRNEMTSQIPPHMAITIDDAYSNAILEQAKYAVPMPSIPAMGSYWGPMATTFANVWNGADVQSEIDAAATAMKETIQ